MKQYFKISLFFLSYILIMILKRNTFPSVIVFYEGIIVSVILCVCIYFFKFLKFDHSIILFFICIYFWSLGPTILDRSVSITVLGKLSENENYSLVELNNDFKDTYVYRNKAVEKRIVEQVYNGNVNQIDGNYSLSKKGVLTKNTILYLTKIFNIDDSYIKRQ